MVFEQWTAYQKWEIQLLKIND